MTEPSERFHYDYINPHGYNLTCRHQERLLTTMISTTCMHIPGLMVDMRILARVMCHMEPDPLT
jgi:protein-arginine kinase